MPTCIVSVLALVALASSASSAWAQDQPTTFVHGFNSTGESWREAAARLETQLAIRVYTPTTSWRETFNTQVSELQGQLSSPGGSPVVVGHSNGGLVARQWSRQTALRGIATIGTPHAGAAVVNNLAKWLAFNQDLTWRLAYLLSAAGNAGNGWAHWVAYVAQSLQIASGVSDPVLTKLGQAVGLKAGLPVLSQMAVNSSFLNDLNSAANLSREATEVANRVGIASFDARYYYGGPYWVIDPDTAPVVANALLWARSILLFAANAILSNAEFEDFAALDLADAMFEVAGWINFYNEAWCRTISTRNWDVCWLSDGLVPAWSQLIPGTTHAIAFQGGPPHTRQTRGSDEAVRLALTTYLGLPARGAGGGTDGGGGASGGGGGGATGGGSGGGGTGAGGGETGSGGGSGSSGGVSSGDIVRQGQRLSAITSSDGRYKFVYQTDGNLVLYAPGNVPLWSSGTSGFGHAILQADGNFVVYNHTGQPVWSSDTVGTGDQLIAQNDGNVVLYRSNGQPVWSTGTAGGIASGTGQEEACASPSGHEHGGSCGGADACGHVFGADTDCGCAHAPIAYDTCYHTVCDSDDVWVDDYCWDTQWVCSPDDPGNCYEEPYSYVCGGHWSTVSANCREEAYQCNPHQCGN